MRSQKLILRFWNCLVKHKKTSCYNYFTLKYHICCALKQILQIIICQSLERYSFLKDISCFGMQVFSGVLIFSLSHFLIFFSCMLSKLLDLVYCRKELDIHFSCVGDIETWAEQRMRFGCFIPLHPFFSAHIYSIERHTFISNKMRIFPTCTECNEPAETGPKVPFCVTHNPYNQLMESLLLSEKLFFCFCLFFFFFISSHSFVSGLGTIGNQNGSFILLLRRTPLALL